MNNQSLRVGRMQSETNQLSRSVIILEIESHSQLSTTLRKRGSEDLTISRVDRESHSGQRWDL